MKTETMTLTRALVECKSIPSRIGKILDAHSFIECSLGTTNPKVIKSKLPVSEAENSIKENWQSVQDLLKRYRAIKGALVQANATIQVTIAGETLSIAQAIERKNSILIELDLLEKIKSDCNNVLRDFNILENQLNESIDKNITTLYGSDKSKITDEQLKLVREAKTRDFQPNLVDPLHLSTVIKELDSKIDAFRDEVDFVLSEANASNKITVEY